MSPKKQKKSGPLLRVLRILRDLQTLGGADVYELAARAGVSDKTIRRDLATLERAGLPLVDEPDGKRKRWRIAYPDAVAKPAERIHTGHYLALRLAMEAAGPARSGPATFATLEDLADRIDGSLGEADRRRLRAIEGAFLSLDKFAYQRAPAEVFDPLIDAIADRRICRVRYQSAGAQRPKRYEVLPLKLFVHAAAPYLLAHSPRHGSPITLNLQRLVAVEQTKKQGEAPEGFDAERWVSAAFGIFANGPLVDFELRFRRSVAEYIRERVWHPTQTIRTTRSGEVVLKFRCVDSYEVSSWVASWRDAVRVIAPASLREKLGELGAWLVETYADPVERAQSKKKSRTSSSLGSTA